jgi:hypothetical protein
MLVGRRLLLGLSAAYRRLKDSLTDSIAARRSFIIGLHLRHALRRGIGLSACMRSRIACMPLPASALDFSAKACHSGSCWLGQLEFALEPGQALLGTSARFHHAAALHRPTLHLPLHAHPAVGTATGPCACAKAPNKTALAATEAGNHHQILFHGVLLGECLMADCI